MSNELNLYQRLSKIMADVKYIQKEDKKVNNQYTFVSHDAVTAKCRQAFIDHGVFVRPSIIEHEASWYDTKVEKWIDKKKQIVDVKSLRTEVHIEVEFINIDDPKDSMKIASIGYGLDTQDKGIGKAYSYAYKYALLKTLMLETGDDPEKDMIDHVPEKIFKSRKARNELYNEIMDAYSDCKSLEDVVETFKKYQEGLGKIMKDCEQNDELDVYNQLVKAKDDLKNAFSEKEELDEAADNFRNG